MRESHSHLGVKRGQARRDRRMVVLVEGRGAGLPDCPFIGRRNPKEGGSSAWKKGQK